MILKNRCDIVETTCLMVLSLAFIIEKSQEFLTAKSDLFESESNSFLFTNFYLKIYRSCSNFGFFVETFSNPRL